MGFREGYQGVGKSIWGTLGKGASHLNRHREGRGQQRRVGPMTQNRRKIRTRVP